MAELRKEDLWVMADKLRNNMDSAEYKHVCLGLIFLKYISDSFERAYQEISQDEYADPEDRDEYLAKNVFWVPQEARWETIKNSATPLSPDDPKVNVLSELARSCKKGSQLDSFTNEINRFTIENLTEEEVKSILQDFSYVTVVSSLDNNRIKRQSGAFILFGMVYNNFESDLYSNKNVPFHIKKKNIELTINARNALLEKLKFQIAEENDEDIDEGMKEYINKQNRLLADKIHSYVIPKERKKYILEELDKLGISQKTLFPEIDHQTN